MVIPRSGWYSLLGADGIPSVDVYLQSEARQDSFLGGPAGLWSLAARTATRTSVF